MTKINDRFDTVTGPGKLEGHGGGQLYPNILAELKAKPVSSKNLVLMLSTQIFRPSTVIQLPGGKYRDRRDSSQPNFDRYIKPISIGGGGRLCPLHRDVTNNF